MNAETTLLARLARRYSVDAASCRVLPAPLSVPMKERGWKPLLLWARHRAPMNELERAAAWVERN